ncbi:hypothetical protein VB735_16595 [Halotia wernerae UHCC 0503]|nr:hypothetical protein [Halotia wernerae UHCC 0503]
MRKLILFILFLSTVNSVILPDKIVAAEQTESPSLWVKIYRSLLKRKEPPVEPRNGGSRPLGTVCMISPDAPPVTRIVWSDRPLFLWHGEATTIEVMTVDEKIKLWDKTVNKIQDITYTGEPLQLGKTYKWVVNSNQFVTFKIIDKQERDRITQDLQNIENKLKSTGANLEAIASAKANYFAENNLWIDVLQQIYSVPKPSAELKAFRQDIVHKLCRPV